MDSGPLHRCGVARVASIGARQGGPVLRHQSDFVTAKSSPSTWMVSLPTRISALTWSRVETRCREPLVPLCLGSMDGLGFHLEAGHCAASKRGRLGDR